MILQIGVSNIFHEYKKQGNKTIYIKFVYEKILERRR